MRRKLFLFAVIITVAVFFITYLFPDIWVPDGVYEDREAEAHQGLILSVKQKENVKTLTVRDERGFRVRLNYYGNEGVISELTGKRISYISRLTYGDPRRNPGCFDYRKYLRSSDCFLTGNVSSFTVISESKALNMKYSSFLSGLRLHFEETLPEKNRGMITGMLFGDTGGIDEDIYEEFKRNGTAHVLAVSGLHIGLLYKLYEKLCGNKASPLNTAFLGFLLYTYGTLTLWSPSVFRAEIMIAMKTAARIRELRYDSLTSMSLAAVLLIMKNPYVIYNMGFQMSFLAIISMNVLTLRLPETMPDTIKQALSVNISMILYQAYAFNYVSPLAFLINIPVLYAAGIAIPISFVTFSGFAVWYVYGLDSIPEFLFAPASAVTEMLVRLNSFLAMDGRLTFDVVSPPLPLVISALCILFFVCSEYAGILKMRDRKSKRSFVIAVIVVLSLISGAALYEPAGHDGIVFVDVGQGACTHIRVKGANVLIDGGGSRDRNVGEKVLKPYLLKNGTRSVDLSLATHEDTDHIKGLYELRDCFNAEDPVTGAVKGRKYEISDEVTVEVVWPDKITDDTQGNEESSVFLIVYRGVRILVTGDLDMDGERKMTAYYRERGMEDKLKADILNVGHHGSHTSTSDELLDAVNPRIAVIQVGRNNYGHPRQEVLDRLESRGIAVFRNDRNGAIGIDIKKKGEMGYVKAVHVMIEDDDSTAM